ncbi:MAG: hypothetical protein JWO84_661 [Parcubacteria group bacterium]|nr:hypothetical protein [Parcubacteria group bacterium]
MAEKVVKKTWTAVIASFEETLEALKGANALEFPLIAIPWGAEREGTDCRAFWSVDDISEDVISGLLESAYPFQGKRSLHLVSVKSNLALPAWGVILNKSVFTLPEL